MLVDTHCHLYLEQFQEDLPEVLQRAWDAGLVRILIPGIDLATSRQAVELSERHENLYAAVGVHPNSALSWDDETPARLQELALHPKVVALGEIGLDYYRDHAPHDLQREIFRQQLDLAAGLNLPVVIHNRQSSADLWAQLGPWHEMLARRQSPLASRPGVWHSYEGDRETAVTAINSHFFIGVSGPLTYRNADERRQVIAGLPLEALLVETDAPYLAPHPYRGRRNEPAFVASVAEKLAELHQLPLSELQELTIRNADQLFHWGVLFE